MANRPVFISNLNGDDLVKTKGIDFEWFSGFALVQKQKCIESFHKNILQYDSSLKILEVSSKSTIDLGVKLSAFNLMITTKKDFSYSVETAFQASKVFELGGPFEDLYYKSSKEAKKDARLKNSGKLLAFDYFNRTFPLEPKTFFYNWLYVNALNLNTELKNQVLEYNTFTDIEFNPNKSINCQAEAVAIYVTLVKKDLLSLALSSVENFKKVVYEPKKASGTYLNDQLKLL